MFGRRRGANSGGGESPSRSTSRAAQARPPRSRAAFSDGVMRVVAVGGDGTLDEVINGYFDESGRAINPLSAVGLLPSGTGSDFRRTLGLATTADALRALARGRPRSLDAARIAFAGGGGVERSRHLINLASFGLGGDAVRLVSDWRGRWPRWVEVARASSRRRSARSGATATPTSASAWTGRAS